jgi:hypothetical protein
MQQISRRAAIGLGGLSAAAFAATAAGVADAATATPADLPDITAAAPVPDQIGGCVGFVRGQVARLSVHVRHIIGEFPPDPIDVALRIRNLNGDVLAEQILTNVPANQGGYVDLHYAAAAPGLLGQLAPSAIAARIQLVGEIEHTRGYTIGGTLEIIDAGSGHTRLSIQPCVIPAPTEAPITGVG